MQEHQKYAYSIYSEALKIFFLGQQDIDDSGITNLDLMEPGSFSILVDLRDIVQDGFIELSEREWGI